MSTNAKLQTTLDGVPYGDENLSDELKVTKQLPEGVKSKELYRDIMIGNRPDSSFGTGAQSL